MRCYLCIIHQRAVLCFNGIDGNGMMGMEIVVEGEREDNEPTLALGAK